MAGKSGPIRPKRLTGVPANEAPVGRAGACRPGNSPQHTAVPGAHTARTERTAPAMRAGQNDAARDRQFGVSQPSVRKPTQAPSGTCSPALGSWARTRAPSPVGPPSGTPPSTTFSPAPCTMAIASGRVSPSTFGTAVAASPLATHVGVAEVEVAVDAVTVEVVVGAATESSSVHPAKLSNPTPTTRRTRGRTGAYCPNRAHRARRMGPAQNAVAPTGRSGAATRGRVLRAVPVALGRRYGPRRSARCGTAARLSDRSLRRRSGGPCSSR